MSDLYRRNPARDVEAFAVRMLRAWVGTAGVVDDQSSGPEPDFRVHYNDGRVGIGEVAWHEDEAIQAMWQATFRRERHQQVALSAGLGQWAVSLVRGARIDRLYDDLPALLSRLSAVECFSVDIHADWPRDEFGDSARALGIEHIARVNAHEPSMAMFFMPPTGGQLTGDPNLIVDWIDELVAHPRYQDMTQKVLTAEADERHIFVMSGSATPHDADDSLQQIANALPTRSPILPTGITHVWVASRYGSQGVGLWTEAFGWCSVPVPPV
jgi:hypothetical protein